MRTRDGGISVFGKASFYKNIFITFSRQFVVLALTLNSVWVAPAFAENENPSTESHLVVMSGQAPFAQTRTGDGRYDFAITVKNGTRYSFAGAPYSEENLQLFESLSPDEQSLFLERRAHYLARFASLMHYTRLVYGTGSISIHNVKQALGPSLSLLKFSLGMFFDDSKNVFFTTASQLREVWQKFAGTRAGGTLLKASLPAMTVSKSGLEYAVQLIKNSNAELKSFDSWLINKMYPEKQDHSRAELVAEAGAELLVAPPIQELAVASLEAEDSQTRVITPAAYEPPKKFIERVKERSQTIVQSLVQKLDEVLWAKQRLVVKQNEFVVVIGLHVQALTGVGHQVTGGVPHGLGIKLGFNTDSRSLVFEIYHETETLTNAVTPSTVYGLSPKIGVAALNQIPGREMRMREGPYIYPTATPGLPISPSYTAMMTDYFTVGWSTSLFNAPLSVLSEFFWYDTYAYQRPLLRLTLSPFPRGFGFNVKFMAPEVLSAIDRKNSVPEALAQPVKLLEQTLEQLPPTSQAQQLPTTQNTQTQRLTLTQTTLASHTAADPCVEALKRAE